MAIFSSIIVTALCISCNIHWVLSQDHEALVVITNSSSSTGISLPTAIEFKGQIIYPKKYKDGSEIEYSYLCPPQTSAVAQDVEQISVEDPELKFCLEKNSSIDKPTKCLAEVKPIFIKQRKLEQPETQCGKSPDHITYNFGFSYLRFINDPPFRRRITTLSLYDVCFNRKDSKTLWTKHQLEIGLILQESRSLLQELGLPSQQIQPSYESFSTEDYALPEDTFSKIAKKYKEQNSRYKMIPQMLVPHEDFALKIWKKTTTHIVNTAPLWDELVPLMEIINDGIRKAGILVDMKDTLYIYTIAYPYLPSDNLDQFGIKVVDDSETEYQFGMNIWCKFVHYESENSGVMIYLHNLPDVSIKKNDPAKRYITIGTVLVETKCQRSITCDFRRWSKKAERLSDDILNHAYCCEVNNEKVEELFNIKLDTKLKLFNINRINIEGKI